MQNIFQGLVLVQRKSKCSNLTDFHEIECLFPGQCQLLFCSPSERKYPAGFHPTEAAKETKLIHKYALQAQECVPCKISPKRTTGDRSAAWKGSMWWFKGQKPRNLKNKTFPACQLCKICFCIHAYKYLSRIWCHGFQVYWLFLLSITFFLHDIWHILCLSSLLFYFIPAALFLFNPMLTGSSDRKFRVRAQSIHSALWKYQCWIFWHP